MIVLGRITGPHGVQGWLKLHPFGDDPDSWRAIKDWWLGRDDQDFSGWRDYPLHTLRLQGRHWVVKLVGVDDRLAAEAISGCFVGAPRQALPVPDEGEFYWSDLIGLVVVNEQQEMLGHVAEMIEAGAHAVMVVKEIPVDAATVVTEPRQPKPPRQPRQQLVSQSLIPFVAAVVKTVDVAAGRITVDWQSDW